MRTRSPWTCRHLHFSQTQPKYSMIVFDSNILLLLFNIHCFRLDSPLPNIPPYSHSLAHAQIHTCFPSTVTSHSTLFPTLPTPNPYQTKSDSPPLLLLLLSNSSSSSILYKFQTLKSRTQNSAPLLKSCLYICGYKS